MKNVCTILLFLATMMTNAPNAFACISKKSVVSTAQNALQTPDKLFFKERIVQNAAQRFFKHDKSNKIDSVDNRETEPLAVLGLISSLLSLFFITEFNLNMLVFFALLGLVLSFIALYKINKDPSHKKGDLLAILGLIPGFIVVVILLSRIKFR
jgi:hypothetical protein